MAVSLETRVTAFVDILGFSALMAKLKERVGLLESIERALFLVRDKVYQAYIPEGPPVNCLSSTQAPRVAFVESDERSVEMSACSDCLVISDRGPQAFTVIARAQELAFTLLEKEGLIFRGAVVVDDLYHRKEIAFGPALVKAVELEKRVARFPRIIVDEACATSYLEWEERLQLYLQSPPPEKRQLPSLQYPRLLERDPDGYYSVNLFVPIPDLVEGGWRLDGKEWPERFRAVRSQLTARLEETLREGNKEHVDKIRWLVQRFNVNVQTPEFNRRVCTIPPIPL